MVRVLCFWRELMPENINVFHFIYLTTFYNLKVYVANAPTKTIQTTLASYKEFFFSSYTQLIITLIEM